MSILVLADHDNLALKTATLNTISAANKLGRVNVLIAGFNCSSVANSMINIQGVEKISY